MNEYHQIKRAVYYTLLIICLIAALATLFLPYVKLSSPFPIHSRAYSGQSITAFSYINPGDFGKYLRKGYDDALSVVSLAVLLPAFLAAFFLLRSVFIVLRNLDREGSISTELKISLGPGVGAGLCALLFLIGTFLSLSADSKVSPSLYTMSFWPVAGLLFNLCALRLARVLNAERPRPAADQGR